LTIIFQENAMDFKELTCPTCGFPAPEIVQKEYFKCPACGSVLILTDLQENTSILCPACQTVNAETRQHCSNCGEKLKINCPFCSTSNAVDNLNCTHCGVNLQTAQRRKKDWVEEYRQKTEERLALTRQVEAESRKTHLKELIDDLDEPEKHSFAIYCLNQMGNYAVEALIETLQADTDPDARFGAAIALGNIGNQIAIPALIRALQEPEPVVRYWAIDALQKFGTNISIEALKTCTNDPHHGVRERAKQALQALGVTVNKPSRWPFG
jgi:hypothetical protein